MNIYTVLYHPINYDILHEMVVKGAVKKKHYRINGFGIEDTPPPPLPCWEKFPNNPVTFFWQHPLYLLYFMFLDSWGGIRDYQRLTWEVLCSLRLEPGTRRRKTVLEDSFFLLEDSSDKASLSSLHKESNVNSRETLHASFQKLCFIFDW